MLPLLARVVATKTAGSLFADQEVSGTNVDLTMSVTMNASAVLRALDGKRRQIPYALQTGINKTAESVREAEASELPKVFNIRSGWWKPGRRYGVNVAKARKSMNPTARVYTRAPWLVDHVTGGVRRPTRKHRAVPKEADKYRKQSGGITRPWLPSNIKNKFEIPIRGGKSLLFTYNKNSKNRTLAYLLIPQANIRPVYDWKGVALKTFHKTAEPNFRAAIKHALATAR